ncbi:uncharacterized protein LOC144308882 [Canis aureus]
MASLVCPSRRDAPACNKGADLGEENPKLQSLVNWQDRGPEFEPQRGHGVLLCRGARLLEAPGSRTPPGRGAGTQRRREEGRTGRPRPQARAQSIRCKTPGSSHECPTPPASSASLGCKFFYLNSN